MDLHGRKIVVTGGAGFIGSELVRQLADKGATVEVADNLANGKVENLMGVIGDQVSLNIVDVRDVIEMRKLLDGADLVYHLACLGVRHSIHNPLQNHDVNAKATLVMLEESQKAAVNRFVYVSTSEVYGSARYVPMTEDHPTFPHTVYGSSKLAGEGYTRAYHDTYGFESVIVRPFNVFGPRCHHEGDSGEVIPKFMLRCLAGQPMVVFGDGWQTRDFTFVSDTARGIALAGTVEDAIGETINLGRGEEITILELVEAIKAALRKSDADVEFDLPRPGDVSRLFADSTKATDLLGYIPEVGFHEGLDNLAAWYSLQGKSAEDFLADEVRHNWKVSG